MVTAVTNTEPRRRNRRGEGGKLREEIIAAAVALLDEGGDERAVTLRSVARKAGIAAPSIYAHFADQPSIMLAVVQREMDALAVALREADENAGPDARRRLFAVCNARFIGGGYPVAPQASLDDGLMDVLVVPQMPTLEFLAVLQRIAAGDEGEAGLLVRFRAASLDLEFSRIVRVNTDGEVLETPAAHYRIHRRAARFFSGPEPFAASRPEGWRPLTD